MKKSALLGLSILLVTSSAAVHADPKPWRFSWGYDYPEHQPLQYFYENPRWEHPEQFKQDLANWKPQDWVNESHGSGDYLLYKWEQTGILHDQKSRRGVPELVVGPNFYHLSGLDKRRVLATVDHVTGRTAQAPYFFNVTDWKSGKLVGRWEQNQTFVTK